MLTRRTDDIEDVSPTSVGLFCQSIHERVLIGEKRYYSGE